MPYSVNNNVRTYYEVVGNGPPLFLHVGAFVEGDLWKLAGYLGRLKEYQLILNDPRGRGKSDRPKTLASHRMENYVADVLKILDDLHISRAGFWGHSDGARVGFALAATHPNRLKALVAVGGHDLPTEYRDRVTTAKDIRKRGLRWVRDLIQKSYGKKLPLWYRKTLHRRDSKIGELEMLAWKPWINKWDTYAKIRVPTIITAGDKDDRTGLSKKIASMIPNSKLAMMKGQGHFDSFMRSDVSTRCVKPFLRRYLSKNRFSGG